MQAKEMGYDEGHLFLRFVQFEFASFKHEAGKPPPVFITAIQEDDSSVDRSDSLPVVWYTELCRNTPIKTCQMFHTVNPKSVKTISYERMENEYHTYFRQHRSRKFALSGLRSLPLTWRLI